MKELRANTSSQVLRVMFAFDPTRSAILLVGGDKRGGGQKQFYKRLIEVADALYDAHLDALKKKDKD